MAGYIVREVRASVHRGGGADYHDQREGHRIDNHIATSMSIYPNYRQNRRRIVRQTPGFGVWLNPEWKLCNPSERAVTEA